MSAKIIRTYTQDVPALRFVGITYGDADRVNGGFGTQWGEWMATGKFEPLTALVDAGTFDDADAFIGLMRYKEGEPFQYRIGMFVPADTVVPAGYTHADFPASRLGVCWLKGQESELYMQEERCADALAENGYEVAPDDDGAYWFFERYAMTRFDAPDESGNIVLDICHFVE